MDKFEQLMEKASDEVRQTTRGATPPMSQLAPRGSRPKWLAFAAGFAVVVLAIGFLPTLVSGENPPVGGPAPTMPPDTTHPESPTTLEHGPTYECSSTGVPVPGPIEGLPLAVAATRDAIIAAAVDCDFDALETIGGPNFTIFFGSRGVVQFRYWEEEWKGHLGTLLHLFGMSHAVIDYPDAPTEIPAHYVWPAAFSYERWEDVPQNLREELLVLYTESEMEELFGGFGSYAGWRTSIEATGYWRYFTSGD